MSYLTRFALFWYDFIVGDDWIIAAAIALTLLLLLLLKQPGLWWVLPLVVILGLGTSLWRATR